MCLRYFNIVRFLWDMKQLNLVWWHTIVFFLLSYHIYSNKCTNIKQNICIVEDANPIVMQIANPDDMRHCDLVGVL